MTALCSRIGFVRQVPKGRWRLSWSNRGYGRNLGSLIRTKLETLIDESIQVLIVLRKCALYIVLSDVHCADGKRCLLLHVPAAPPSSSAQEKTRTLRCTEPHHSSWQCNESHRCCCLGPLAPLSMEGSETFTVLTRYDSMRLRSLRQSARTTARDSVQHKRWTCTYYRTVITEH